MVGKFGIWRGNQEGALREASVADWPDPEWGWDARVFALLVLIAWLTWMFFLFKPIVAYFVGG